MDEMIYYDTISNFLLNLFEISTILLSIISIVLGATELYLKIEKKIHRIRIYLLVVAGLTVVSATGTKYFGDKLAKTQEQFYNKQLKAADERIAKNEAIAASSNLKSDSLEHELVKTILELEKLRASVKDRVIPSSKIPLVKDILSKHKNERISIICLGSDIEAVNFMNQLASLFKSYGWLVHSHGVVIFGKAQPPGLRILINDMLFEERARDVRTIFEKFGFASNIFLDTTSDRELQVIVGAKERAQID